MARTVGKLSPVAVKNAARRGYYSGGGGLYLQVSPSGAKSWVFRYKAGSKLYEMGLGPTHTIGLAEARTKARRCREQRLAGPIWAEQPETAARVRGRIEAILDWATARGHRQGENPARWRGHLDKLLPARSKIRKVKHHAALPYAELPGFMATLREQEGISARALEYAILTAARNGEAVGAAWGEIDLGERTWTILG